MWAVETSRTRGHSPLRYPGGKSSLFRFLVRVLEANGLRGGTYVEPYAGGAGAALALLNGGHVAKIVVNDLDPAIHAFWDAAVNRSEAFRSLVVDAQLNVDEWRRQRDIYREKDTKRSLELGFSAFYLNRTNRSGVMNAGVIGGLDQKGDYRIDARFNRAELLSRLDSIAARSSQIEVTNVDGVDLIRDYVGLPECLVYADPPYYDKGSFLYMNSFNDEDHVKLASCLNANSQGNWILTYDNSESIKKLYAERSSSLFGLHYSAHTPGLARELMVISDGLKVD